MYRDSFSVWQSQNWFEGGITATTNLVGREVVHSATNVATKKVSQAWNWFSRNLVRKNAPQASQSVERYLAKDNINIGKQIGSSTKNKTSVQNALTHWNNHKNEFSELYNAKQYVERSRNLFQNTNEVFIKNRFNGDILLYHKESNIFGAFTKEGIPKTMFRPKKGIHYWERQIE